MTGRNTSTLQRGIVAALGLAMTVSVLVAGSAVAVTGAAVDAGTASALQSLAVDQKLAHDAYAALGDSYDAVLFDNIAQSEARHQTTVAELLAKHGIENVTAGDGPGVFDDAAVQATYNELLSEGATSLPSALGVGVTLEEREIANLTGILASTVPKDVRQVATNLLDAERNHLDAFRTALASASTSEPPIAPVRLVQSAEVRTQASGRYHVGDTLLLSARPVKTDAGVTIRWRVTKESRYVCEVRTREGRSTVALLRPGTCRVEGIAPAPSPEYFAYSVARVYRAVR